MKLRATIKEKIKYVDKVYWFFFLFLVTLSILVISSASSTLTYKATSFLGNPIVSHILFLAFGVVVAFFIQFLPSWVVRPFAYLGLGIAFIFLLATLFPSLPFVVTYNDATRWVRVFGITFQPAEISKLCLIIVVTDQLTRIKDSVTEKKIFYTIIAIVGTICLIIMKENLSTAVLIALIVFFLLILSKVHFKYVFATAAVAITLIIGTYLIVEYGYVRKEKVLSGPLHRLPTQVKRIDMFLYGHKTQDTDKMIPLYEMDGSQYQTTLANVAIARGGENMPFGVGPGQSRERDFLPLAFADYIFAIIVEEWGLVGAIVFIISYLTILFRACITSNRYPDYAAMLMVMGLALMITTQAFVSMAVSVGIIPVTGQPLPIISRGGTSIIITSIYFGIIMCVAREQNELKHFQEEDKKQSYEIKPKINIPK